MKPPFSPQLAGVRLWAETASDVQGPTSFDRVGICFEVEISPGALDPCMAQERVQQLKTEMIRIAREQYVPFLVSAMTAIMALRFSSAPVSTYQVPIATATMPSAGTALW
jgi:hypothetical protein